MTKALATRKQSELANVDLARANFEVLRRSGRKASTVHQYTQTEAQWQGWCTANGLDPANFEVAYVDRFFQSLKDQYSRVTLQNKLSHLRKAVEALAASSDETAGLYTRQWQALKAYKIDCTWGGPNSHKRGGRRVNTATVWEAIHADGSNALMQSRNAAFYALLFFAGLRRSELRNLQWEHVDFDSKVIKVIGGKKRAANESDNVPMLGDLIAILKTWRTMQTQAADGNPRQYVMSAIRKGGKLGSDKPLASGAVYDLMAVYDAMPHDARHTLVTNLLEKAVPVHIVQKIARHKKAETTMRYAHSVEASELAKTVPDPYG
jgi:integrase